MDSPYWMSRSGSLPRDLVDRLGGLMEEAATLQEIHQAREEEEEEEEIEEDEEALISLYRRSRGSRCSGGESV